MKPASFSALLAAGVALTAACATGAAPFDYYVLSLSWSPQFCAQPGEAVRNPKECAAGRKNGFTVHGLWPEVVSGRAPENCGAARGVPKAVIGLMLPEMFSAGLIRHEWQAHGSCTGLSASDFFTSLQQARAAVQVPVQFAALDAPATETPAAIQEQFEQANPAFPPGAFRAICRNEALTEVRICFDKNLKSRACAATAGACPSRQITIRPPE